MSAGLTPAECRSVAVHYALCGMDPVLDPELAPMLAAKTVAARVFMGPVAMWEGELNEHAIRSGAIPETLHKCGCKCGCQNVVTECAICYTCSTPDQLAKRCYQCFPITGALDTQCHACLGKPKDLCKDVQPVWNGGGLTWYFDYPEAKPWLTETRDVSLDPRLVSIVEVYKVQTLTQTQRRVRPFNWQRAFRVDCVMCGPGDEEARVTMSMRAFLQNPVWHKHPMIGYVLEWLPGNLAHIGPVFNTRPSPVPLPPQTARSGLEERPRVDKYADHGKAPPNPSRYNDLSLDAERALMNDTSTVQVEELSDEEDVDMAQISANLAKLNARAMDAHIGRP